MRTALITLFGASLMALTGCNAIYFYETDKVSLTVEVRPDSTGPIQGNFGFKQRVVAFVPKRNGAKPAPPPTGTKATAGERQATLDTTPTAKVEKAAAEAEAKNPGGAEAPAGSLVRKNWYRDYRDALADESDSDALDVLSSLRFHKLPKPDGAPWYKVSHMTIDSALITGGAARHVANPGRAIAALSGQPLAAGAPKRLALRAIYDALDKATNNSAAQEHKAALDALANRLPSTYPFNRYTRTDAASPNLKKDPEIQIGKPVTRDDFDDVLTYWGMLDATEQVLSRVPEPLPATMKVDDVDADAVRLKDELITIRALLADIDRSIGGSAASRKAAAYFARAL